jgi:hypothetical protein
MAHHTPAPWVAEFSEMGGYDCMTDAWVVVAGHKRVAVLDLSSYGQAHCVSGFASPEAEANARLIAAAPDLLAAVREYLEWGPMTGSDRDLFNGKFSRAIAKAEGQ